jgi:hypothetical protein
MKLFMEKQGMNSAYDPNCKEALSDPEVFEIDILPMPEVLKEAYNSLVN